MALINVDKFRFFSQVVLPAVYDESLSYYEVLNKVRYKLNEVINSTNAQNDVIRLFIEEINNAVDNFIHAMVSDYDTTKSYVKGNYCWYNNALYKCKGNTSGSFDSGMWDEVVFADAIGEEVRLYSEKVDSLISQVAPAYKDYFTYEVGEMCVYEDVVYVCRTRVYPPGPFDPEKWERAVITTELKNRVDNYWEKFINDYQETLGIVQTTGSSVTDVMSQKATTDEFKRLSRYTNNTETTIENANNIINLLASHGSYVYVNKQYFSYNYKEYCYEVYGESVSGGGLFTIINYVSGLPSVFEPGSYTFICNSKTHQGDDYTTNLYLQITIYNEGGDLSYSVRGRQTITIPNTATGIRLRVMTTTAFSALPDEPAKCYVRAYRYMTNKDLVERVNTLNNDALINMGVLPSGAISAINIPNSIYTLVNSNTYSDYPDTDTITKYGFVKTLNTISMWEQTLVTFATEANPNDAGEIWYRSGTSVHTTGNYNEWIKINVKPSELNNYAVYKIFPGTEENPQPIINIIDGHRFYSSYLLPNQTSTQLTNVQNALEVLVFGTQASRGYIGIQANKLALLVGTRDSSTDIVKNATVKLTSYNHNLAMFGDSITWGRDSAQSGVVATAHTFEKTIARNLGINATNFGVGSQGWLVAAGTPQYTAYQKIKNTDITPYTDFTLAWGVNDYTTVRANNWQLLGEYNTTDETTMIGQMYKTVAYIYSQVPNANVIVIPPWNGTSFGTFPLYKYTENGYNPMLTVMEKFAEYYGLPLIDMKNSPINAWTLQTWFNDGVHPNTNGYKIIGSWLAGELGKIIG